MREAGREDSRCHFLRITPKSFCGGLRTGMVSFPGNKSGHPDS